MKSIRELSIRDLLKQHGRHLGLTLCAGEAGVDRCINSSDIHRPALALTGFVDVFTVNMIQVLGNHEIEYLRTLTRQQRREALEIIYQFALPCVVVTAKGRLLSELKELADRYTIPLIKSEFATTKFIHLIHHYLDDAFAPQVTMHGTLIDVHGIGLLFTGRSGIGKSEVGLDLVERGHRLVADDTVFVTRKSQGMLVGDCPEILRDHMEIRGIGLINVKRMFGVRGTRRQKRVEVMVRLEDWNENAVYERVGLEDSVHAILGVEIPVITVPLFPGKNITVIAETIAFNHLLRLDGYHPARDFNGRLLESMRQQQLTRQPLASENPAEAAADDPE